mgnify:CR=1 FL=1
MDNFSKWFKQAKHDLEVAEYNYKGNFFDSSIFYSQQSVEKALKSLLIKKEDKFLKIHDLVMLGKKVDLPEKFFRGASKLNSAYIASRYNISPDKIPAELFSKKETKEFLNLAKEILKWAENQM